jgi:Ca2+-binding RTX toxin-like protein
MVGGLGNDSYGVDDLGDVVTENLNEGTDSVNSSITYTLGANLENLALAGNTVIHGTGNELNNTLNGSSNSAANVLTGLTGDDTYIVGTGDTVVENAGEGTDTVQAGITYTLAANLENLTLTGGTAINGTGNTLDNVLTGNNLNNALYGQAGNDTLIGLAGNDTLNGGTGADTMTGGTGNDVYVVDNAGDTTIENLNEGTDTVQSSITYTLGANLENLTLTGSAAINGTGNELNNVISGNGKSNTIYGGAGNDTIISGTFSGGFAIDYLYGEAGDDILTGGNKNLTFFYGGTGNDTLIAGNSGSQFLNGEDGDDHLIGSASYNFLNGGTGNDLMEGKVGGDTYVVDAVGDIVIELANEGIDSIQSSVTHTLGANVENLYLMGIDAIDGTGNDLNNLISGAINSAANVLAGLAGDDTYIIELDDTVVENPNEGTDTVQSNVTYALGDNVENLILIGSGTIDGTGNELVNVLTGNNANNALYGQAGNDILNGGGGNDTLDGDAGNDTLNGGTGNDTYQFGVGDGQDSLTDNDATAGNTDTVNVAINTLNLVFSQSGNNLLMSLHGTTDSLSITSWYTGTANQTEVFQAADGSTLANTQVDQLIQAMAQFSADNGGITWDQAIDQNPTEVQAVISAYWQGA